MLITVRMILIFEFNDRTIIYYDIVYYNNIYHNIWHWLYSCSQYDDGKHSSINQRGQIWKYPMSQKISTKLITLHGRFRNLVW